MIGALEQNASRPLAALGTLAERCIHCGLCLDDCPTYQQLGSEMDSPRGRILLMRGLADGRAEPTAALRTHLDRCLDCRACESACPSGVQYGALLEHARHELARQPVGAARLSRGERLRNWLIFAVLPHPGRLRWALRLGRLAERLGLNAIAAWVSPTLAPLMRMLPRRTAADECAAPVAAEHAAPTSPQRAAVQFFTGCATSVLTPRTVANAREVLLHNGCAVGCPPAQRCCGAIHHHGGLPEEARRLARNNIDAFDAAASQGEDLPIVTIAAGCGAMLRQYDRLLGDDPSYAARARRFAARVRDISEYLAELGPLAPTRALPGRVTVHDPCHLVHAQRVAAAPRKLLSLIPGVELIECREATMCCGAAGTYNLTQPQIAADLGRRKLANLAATKATLVATGNIGCILHLRSLAARVPPDAADRARPRIAHTIDLLHAAYGLGDIAPDNRPG